MKLNQPLKETRDKELRNLWFDLLLNVAGVILVPAMSGKIYNACIEWKTRARVTPAPIRI